MLRHCHDQATLTKPSLFRRCEPQPAEVMLDEQSRRAIEMAVSQVFGVSHSTLNLETRGCAHAARARQVAMYLAHVACGLTMMDAGRLFRRNRSTVSYACGVIEDRRDDINFNHALDLLENVVKVIAVRPGPFLSHT